MHTEPDAADRHHRGDEDRGQHAVRRQYRSFEQACAYARALCLSSTTDWRQFCGGRIPGKGRRPFDIPSHPDDVYGAEWKGWRHFLGTGHRRFEDAREFARSLGLRGAQDWRRFCAGLLPEKGHKPKDIPSHPRSAYRESWTGWGDFLGNRHIWRNGPPTGGWRTFAEARKFARSLGFRSALEWHRFCTGKRPDLPPRPADLPTNSALVYRGKGWQGWPDFLGSVTTRGRKPGFRMRPWRRFEEAREFARALRLPSAEAWKSFAAGNDPSLGNCPEDIPANPQLVYGSSGWAGWRNFLGTENVNESACPAADRAVA